MIPRSFVKERGEDTEEVSIAPQLPARGEARKVDLREQDETPSAKLTNREECALYENIKFLYPTDNHKVSLGVIRAPVQYPISRLSYDLVKSWSRDIGCLNYRIALKYDRHKSRGFEISGDLTIRRLIGYWNRAQVVNRLFITFVYVHRGVTLRNLLDALSDQNRLMIWKCKCLWTKF